LKIVRPVLERFPQELEDQAHADCKPIPMKTVLFLCAETFPPPYAFLDKVFNTFLGMNGFRMVWVMPSLETRKMRMVTWGNNPVILIPKVRPGNIFCLFQDYRQHFQYIKQASLSALKQHGPFHMVQVRDDPAMAYVAWRLAKKFRIPWVYQVSHLKEEESMMYCQMHIYGSRIKNLIKGIVGFFLRNFLLRRSDLVFPISEQMKETLAGYGVSRNSMVPVSEGVDTAINPRHFAHDTERIREKLGLQNKKVIVYVGTMSRFRQLDFLLKAFKLVLEQHPNTHLLMVGGDRKSEDFEWLKTKSATLGLGKNVTMTGWVPRMQVPAYIRVSCLGVSPVPVNRVYINSSPIKLLEYLALETPAVATDIPEQRKTLLESGGGICTSWSVHDFANAINNILHLTQLERGAIGQHGREWVRKNRDFLVLGGKVYEAYRRLFST